MKVRKYSAAFGAGGRRFAPKPFQKTHGFSPFAHLQRTQNILFQAFSSIPRALCLRSMVLYHKARNNSNQKWKLLLKHGLSASPNHGRSAVPTAGAPFKRLAVRAKYALPCFCDFYRNRASHLECSFHKSRSGTGSCPLWRNGSKGVFRGA